MDKKTIIAATLTGMSVAAALTYHVLNVADIIYQYVGETESGKVVKFVGGDCADSEIRETTFGEVKLCKSIPSEGLCNLVFEAKEKNGFPDVPAIQLWLSPGSMPVKVADSKESNGSFIWSAIFRGNGCLAMAETDGYIGSGMEQLIKSNKRKRFLKVYPKKGAKDDKGNPLGPVSIDHPSADKDQEVYFPHEWSGMDQLNFRRSKQTELE